MKAISIHALLFIACLSATSAISAKSSTEVNQSNPVVSLTGKKDSTRNNVVKINGTQNRVKIKTDLQSVAHAAQNEELQPVNSILINGTGNSVSIEQKSQGEIRLKQNGSNNRFQIKQKNIPETTNP